MSENENKVGVDEIKEPVTTEVANEKPAAEESAPVKKSWGKRIAGIALWVLIVLVAVVLLVLWQIDRVAATATRTIGSAITGTPVDVQYIYKAAGRIGQSQRFYCWQYSRFHNPVAIKVGNFHVALNTASVLTEKIIIDHLELTGVAIDLEYSISKGSNLDAILKNVEKNTGADKKQPEKNADKPKEKTPAKQKQVVIRKLILKDSKVTVSSGMLKTTMSIPLVPIEMTNVGESTDLPGAIKEVLVRIISEIGKVVNFDAIGKGLVSGVEGVGNAAGDVLNKSVELIKNLPGLNSKK